MSRLVRHMLMASPPIEAGSWYQGAAGTYTFVIPLYNTLNIKLVGGGSGGRKSVIGAPAQSYGLPGKTSEIVSLGLKATGGVGTNAVNAGGDGSGGDINTQGTVGSTSGPGTPVPGLNGAGVGGAPVDARAPYGDGAGYTEKDYVIGDTAVLPGMTLTIVIGATGRNGTDGGCLITWG